jgi:predicted RNA-binding protein YlqC (UPF0109 family)
VTHLAEFLVRSVVANPGAVSVNEVEGDASVLLEVRVDPADVERVHGPEGETLRAIRTVISAAAGQRKAVVELIEPDRDAPAESTEDAPTGG